MIKMANSRPIFIYIDDSNLFIQAMRLKKDPRARVNIGKVCDIVAAGRPVAQGFLYGSEPPPAGTVWKKIEKQGVDVTVHEKSSRGKEKKVDTQIVADITERACLTPPEERSTIVVVTGDADMIPGIEVALQYGWKVEVAIWKGAMSADYKKIEVKSKEGITLKPQLRHLNDHCEDIIFINRKWDVACNLSKSAVLKVHKKDFDKWHSPKDWFPKDEWCKEVETLANCQFQYDWADFEDSGVSGIFGLILYFKKVDAGGKVFDLEEFMRSKFNGEKLERLHIISVQEYRSYTQSIKKKIWEGSEKEVICLQEIKTEQEENLGENKENRGIKRSFFEVVKNEGTKSEDRPTKISNNNS